MSEARPPKICVMCNSDCSDRPRIKDPKGRYYCRGCYEQAAAHKAAMGELTAPSHPPTSAPNSAGLLSLEPTHDPAPALHGEPAPLDDVLAQMQQQASAATGVTGGGNACPSCSQTVLPGAIICTNCGANLRTGKTAKTKKKRALASEGEPAADKQTRMALILFAALIAVGLGSFFSEPLLRGFILVTMLISIIVGLWIIVDAFKHGVLHGLGVLFVPLYMLIFLIVVSDNRPMKIAFVGHIILTFLMFGSLVYTVVTNDDFIVPFVE